MTSREPRPLQLVPDVRFSGNEVAPVADDRFAALQARATALDEAVARETAPRGTPWVLVPVAVALTVVLALLGRQAWQLPGRDAGRVTAVPHELVVFLLLCTGLCLWVAGRLVRPAATLRSAGGAQLWWVLTGAAALVTAAADLSLASFAGTGQRPGDLLVRCLVPLVPAVLAGFLAQEAGRTTRIRAALGTGLVTLPLGAVGWALLSSAPRSSAGLGDVLAMTGLAGGAPLLLAVAFVAADRRGRRPR